MYLPIQRKMLNRLWEMIPSSQQTIRIFKEMVPDRISQSLTDYGIFVRWQDMDNWEHLNDMTIAEKSIAVPLNIDPSDRLFILTDSDHNHPIQSAWAEVSHRIDSFLKNRCHSFYNGDVIMISESSNYIYLFHHEGVFSNTFW